MGLLVLKTFIVIIAALIVGFLAMTDYKLSKKPDKPLPPPPESWDKRFED